MQVVLPPDSGPVEVIDRQGMQRPVRYELCPVVHVQQLLPSLHPPPSCYQANENRMGRRSAIPQPSFLSFVC